MEREKHSIDSIFFLLMYPVSKSMSCQLYRKVSEIFSRGSLMVFDLKVFLLVSLSCFFF